jgi:hypothetical protein
MRACASCPVAVSSENLIAQPRAVHITRSGDVK